jgi:hypothetical protein
MGREEKKVNTEKSRYDSENPTQTPISRFTQLSAVLRIRDVYPGSRIRLFSIPDPGRTVSIPDPGSAKNSSFLTPKKTKKMVSKL